LTCQGSLVGIGECALDPVIAQDGTFTGPAQKESDGLFGNRRTPDFPASLAVVPFQGHQFAMPTKDGVRCDGRGAVAGRPGFLTLRHPTCTRRLRRLSAWLAAGFRGQRESARREGQARGLQEPVGRDFGEAHASAFGLRLILRVPFVLYCGVILSGARCPGLSSGKQPWREEIPKASPRRRSPKRATASAQVRG